MHATGRNDLNVMRVDGRFQRGSIANYSRLTINVPPSGELKERKSCLALSDQQ
jgi:hypothetical protein